MVKSMNKTIMTGLMMSALAVSGQVNADKNSETGPFGFQPILESADSSEWNPERPWKLPLGFTQSVVSDETALNIYADRNDWHDMNTVNETGKQAGNFLYRTHELRSPDNQPEGGSVSVVDLTSGETLLLAQDPSFDAVDGIRWTPWHTIVFAEEKTNGRFFELILNEDMISGVVYERPEVGLMAHEGIDIGSDGSIYIVDEHRGLSSGCLDAEGNELTPCGGGLYKFVPNQYGNLTSGNLYALKVTGVDGVGQGEWVGPIDPNNVRLSGAEAGGSSYQRPEDLEIIGDTLYVAITEGSRDENGDQKYDGRVIAINLDTMQVSNFVKPGLNVAVEIGKPGDDLFHTGFDNPDNLAETPDGKLVIIEDNTPSDIWIAGKDHDQDGSADAVWLFGSLTDPKAEGTGIYFGKDPNTMFVNIQHSAEDDGDATWAIRKNRKKEYK